MRGTVHQEDRRPSRYRAADGSDHSAPRTARVTRNDGHISGLPMYDWPEVSDAVDALWSTIAEVGRGRGLELPLELTRRNSLVELWSDPAMLLGQVCSLNPVRDGLGETEVIGTIVYEPPSDLRQPEPGSYYSVLVCRADDERRGDDGVGTDIASPAIERFRGATVAANGTDSQSGYWSLGHFVRDQIVDGPLFGAAIFTDAHRESIRAVADGRADIAAIDVHSWRLALDYEPEAAQRLAVIGTTQPTPGVVCVVSWELAQHRAALDATLHEAIDGLAGSSTADRLHITGYRTRRLEEFQVVADQVEHAARREWHHT